MNDLLSPEIIGGVVSFLAGGLLTWVATLLKHKETMISHVEAGFKVLFEQAERDIKRLAAERDAAYAERDRAVQDLTRILRSLPPAHQEQARTDEGGKRRQVGPGGAHEGPQQGSERDGGDVQGEQD